MVVPTVAAPTPGAVAHACAGEHPPGPLAGAPHCRQALAAVDFPALAPTASRQLPLPPNGQHPVSTRGQPPLHPLPPLPVIPWSPPESYRPFRPARRRRTSPAHALRRSAARPPGPSRRCGCSSGRRRPTRWAGAPQSTGPAVRPTSGVVHAGAAAPRLLLCPLRSSPRCGGAPSWRSARALLFSWRWWRW